MKRHIIIIALITATFTINAQKRLTILHTNDTHSTVMPLNKNLNDTIKAGRGGFIRRIAMLKKERKKDPKLLLFDTGDFAQGSPYYTIFKGDVEIGLMNKMHYDAATIGNHEFDFGLDNMARNFRMAEFPIVCANYDFTGTPVEGLVKPYIIIKRKGVKIGVFGIAPKLEGLVSRENYEGVKYLDPIVTAIDMADMLKKQKKCDVVICLSHLGWNMTPSNIDDSAMIAGSKNIDLVLGGHSHTFFTELKYVKNSEGMNVPIDQNGNQGIFIGKMAMTIRNKK